MKTSTIIKSTLFSALLVGSVMPAEAKSAKRGVSENQFQYKAQMEALSHGVTWFYNWANTMGAYLENEEEMEYVPMCWNANFSADNIRAYVQRHPGTKYILGFNEPNFLKQANMTPAYAAQIWPQLQALAKELDLKLVAPALNYSPDAPYNSPTKWMDEFVELVGKDAFDYVAVHSYGGFGVTKDLCTTFHERYGKDVWLTEFCLWPNEGDSNSYVSPTTQISAMMEMVEWLEKTPFIYRYAWFKSVGNYDSNKGPNYGLLIPGKGEDPRELSPQGLVYTYMPEFDPEDYNGVNETISAADYWTQTACVLGKSADAGNPLPIEINSFIGGSSLDYRFDVPSAGEYTLTLGVSGYGEPTRFDPTVGVYAVEEDDSNGAVLSEPETFTLPNSDETYMTKTFKVVLPAGKQTLRLVGSGFPSGLHISTLKLSDGSGVEEISSEGSGLTDVYSIQGHLLRKGVSGREALKDLPSGLYIVGGKKVIK